MEIPSIVRNAGSGLCCFMGLWDSKVCYTSQHLNIARTFSSIYTMKSLENELTFTFQICVGQFMALVSFVTVNDFQEMIFNFSIKYQSNVSKTFYEKCWRCVSDYWSLLDWSKTTCRIRNRKSNYSTISTQKVSCSILKFTVHRKHNFFKFY